MCLKIRTKAGKIVPLELNPGQDKMQAAIETCRKQDRPPRIVLLKGRQFGGSTDVEARMFHQCHLRPHHSAVVIAHKRESAAKIFQMTKLFLEKLPKSAKPETLYHTKNEIVFDHNGSSLAVQVADEGAGRGITAQYVHLSEFSRYKDPAAVLEAVTSSVPKQVDSLIVVESTANGMNEFYDLWIQAVTGQSDFMPVFVAWFEDPTNVMRAKFTENDLDEYEQELRATYRLTLEQLAWRRFAIRNDFRNDVKKFQQENPATPREAFLASGEPVFNAESIEWHSQHVPPTVELSSLPPQRDISWDADRQIAVLSPEFHGGPLRIYTPNQEPVKRHLYIVGTDPSEGDPGSDPSPCCVLDRMTLEVAATWWGRKRPDHLANTARCLCRYFNNAHEIWESNNTGLAFGYSFMEIYTDYYWREVSQESVSKKKTDKPGYNTNVKSKSLVWNLLRHYFEDLRIPCRDPQLISELENCYFAIKGGNRVVEKFDGKTIDLLWSLGLCLVAHTGDPEADLIPLSTEDYESIRDERRNSYVELSMGIIKEMPMIDRANVTASELEEMDEQEYISRRRRAAAGEFEAT